jgi:hypothetical protein
MKQRVPQSKAITITRGERTYQIPEHVPPKFRRHNLDPIIESQNSVTSSCSGKGSEQDTMSTIDKKRVNFSVGDWGEDDEQRRDVVVENHSVEDEIETGKSEATNEENMNSKPLENGHVDAENEIADSKHENVVHESEF